MSPSARSVRFRIPDEKPAKRPPRLVTVEQIQADTRLSLRAKGVAIRTLFLQQQVAARLTTLCAPTTSPAQRDRAAEQLDDLWEAASRVGSKATRAILLDIVIAAARSPAWTRRTREANALAQIEFFYPEFAGRVKEDDVRAAIAACANRKGGRGLGVWPVLGPLVDKLMREKVATYVNKNTWSAYRCELRGGKRTISPLTSEA